MTIGKVMKFSLTMAVCVLAAFLMKTRAQAPAGKKPVPAVRSARESAVNIEFSKLQWMAMVPEMGENSPMRALLHEHPVKHSSQFLIQMPPNFHVPAHYHTVNETHTVIEGAFIVQVDGKRTELEPGGFNYTPANMVHEAWTPKDKGALIFVTVDGAYDLHPVVPPVNPPPAKRDLPGGAYVRPPDTGGEGAVQLNR